ncbi:MAG: alpha/beta hydrolase [Treponemataceae bacterium]|nr:alpha/beta hydrolase [Treponemataceae bacterium]
MKILNILTGIIAVFLLLFIILTFLVYHFLFKANILRKTDTTSNDYGIEIMRIVNEDSKVCAQWFLEQKPEEIEMTSFDGLKLHAYFLPAPNGAENADATLLLMHGFHGSGLKDFAIVSKFYHQNNYNVLIPDQRTHGKSEGKYITFGIKERFDCHDWTMLLNEKLGDDKNIFMDGVSMGCATVLMACGTDLPPNVKGVIADCGFTSPYEIMKHVITRNMHLPAFPIMPVAGMLTKVIAGFGLKEYSATTAMKNNAIPVLFVHGDADDFVPPYMSEQNYAACAAPKQLFMVPGAIHAMSYFTDTPKSQQTILEFLEKYSK